MVMTTGLNSTQGESEMADETDEELVKVRFDQRMAIKGYRYQIGEEDEIPKSEAEHYADLGHVSILEGNDKKQSETVGTEDDQRKIDATNAAIQLASSEGVNLRSVEGSGKDGRITKRDVEKAAEDEE